MSAEMLSILRDRNDVYGEVHCQPVGGGNELMITDDSYDVVTVCGGYAVAHMPVDSLREICRVLKPGNFHFFAACLTMASPKGGLFINCMTEDYLQSVESLHELEPLMKTMEDEGRWTMLSRETEKAMVGGRNGCFHFFRKATQ